METELAVAETRRARGVAILLLATGCCAGGGASSGTPSYLGVEEASVTGDATHVHVPFFLTDAGDHRFALPGRARIEIRDLPWDSSGAAGTLGEVACACEATLSSLDFGLYPYAPTLDCIFSPPCPPPPTAPGVAREALFSFDAEGTSLPPYPLHELPVALSGGRDRETVRPR